MRHARRSRTDGRVLSTRLVLIAPLRFDSPLSLLVSATYAVDNVSISQ
jgi:hypothetical protein